MRAMPDPATIPYESSGQAAGAARLWAVNLVTFFASIGTGVVWNGISFIAETDYHFEKGRTLLLYLVMGATYVAGAFSAGRVVRMLEERLSPRSTLALILAGEAVVCVSLGLLRTDAMLWIVACFISVLSSWLWPVIESYVSAGRHGASMRSAIGWWNLSWTGAVALSMVVIGPMIKERGRDAIVALGAVHALALLPLMGLPRKPGSHDAELAAAAVQPEYPLLLRAARMLLPVSYVLNSAMSPLLPYLMNALHVDKSWQTPATSTWMWVRIGAITIMWQMPFWHGRWGTLVVGALSMTLGFGLIVMAQWLSLMLLGLALFGVGMGIIYYAALYYAMAVGRAEVDAGGTHEALIGVGYSIGPLTGLASLAMMQAGAIEGEPQFNRTVVAIVWLLILLAAIGVARTYRRAHRGRIARAR
jgi:hypothetical protein